MENDLAGRINNFNRNRDARFLEMKYRAMRDNKFRFFRGTPHLFYEDIPAQSFLFDAPGTWICGDLHLENFGSYKGDNRVTYFNINDFDDSILGSPLFDISRLMTSVYIACESLQIALGTAHELNDILVNTYFETLAEGYIRVLEKETTKGVIKKFLEEVRDRKRKEFIKKRTSRKKDGIRLLIDNVHAAKIDETERLQVMEAVSNWTRAGSRPVAFEACDAALRIAGTSSLGLKRYVVLVEKTDDRGRYYLIDIKETRPSCAAPYARVVQPVWASEAERITETEKRIISDPPAMLQSININGKNFVLRELQPTADKIDYKLFEDDGKKLSPVLASMAGICAWSNLRAAGRQGSANADELISFAKNGRQIKTDLKEFAFRYSKTMSTYYIEYCAAYEKGMLNTN